MQLPRPRQRRPRDRATDNGGFPTPPAGEPVRLLRVSHPQCGAQTRVRIPAALPPSAVRRVVCSGCSERFDSISLAESAGAARALGGALQSGRDRAGDVGESIRARLVARSEEPSSPGLIQSRWWPWVALPLAALAVFAGVSLLDGSGSAPAPEAVPSAESGVVEATAGARLIERPGFSLVLPRGWKRTDPPGDAAFAARSRDGAADATLWIERAPELSFAQFERRSLDQLEEVADDVRIVDRVDGPTLETSIVELRAEAPLAEGVSAPYRVTLRAAGDFRLYFVTVTQPGADPALLGDVELLHGSLRPEVELAGVGG